MTNYCHVVVLRFSFKDQVDAYFHAKKEIAIYVGMKCGRKNVLLVKHDDEESFTVLVVPKQERKVVLRVTIVQDRMCAMC